MTLTADEVRAQVLHVAKAIHAAGLVVGTAGNVSGRTPNEPYRERTEGRSRT